MADSGLRPPGNFDSISNNPSEGNRNWKAWLEQFEFYMVATEKSKKDGKIQVATLLTLLGPQGKEIFHTLPLTAEQRGDIKLVKEAFTKHYTSQVKVVFERFKFNSRIQKPGDSFLTFLTSLRDLMATCDFYEDEKS